jgi:2-keto-4-pentenoate hydratase/2-oxohepta-3-ene-1,7-dioic acid hydratase in catechol pathway
MFHPNDRAMERGWVGRIDGDRVLHLAAQTLQAFFLSGGGAREHAEYRLADVTLLAPVHHPPAVRVFESPKTFEFSNPAAVGGPGATAVRPAGVETLTLVPRLAAVIGAEGAVGGLTLLADWRAPGRVRPKDRDFCSVLGPVVVTPDELGDASLGLLVRVDGQERLRATLAASLDGDTFDWQAARAFAAAGTELRPGDVLAGPSRHGVEGIGPGSVAELEVAGIGTLSTAVAGT